MPTKIVAEGNEHKVLFWAETPEGLEGVFCNCPTIKQHEINKLACIINYYIELGSFPSNWKKFHKLQNEQYLYEIKSHQIRLLGFFYTSGFVIVLCVRKKKDEHSKSDLKRANRFITLALTELNNGT